MLPYHTVNLFLRCAPDEIAQNHPGDRNIVFSVVPDAQEEISGKGWFTFAGKLVGLSSRGFERHADANPKSISVFVITRKSQPIKECFITRQSTIFFVSRPMN